MLRFVILCLFLAACGPEEEPGYSMDARVADAASANDASPDASGNVQVQVGRNDHRLMVDGVERELIVYASEAAMQSDAAPVVFFFHGSNHTGELAYGINSEGRITRQDAGWREVADANGLIVVFPTALNYCFRTANQDGVVNFDDPPEIAEKWTIEKLGDPEQLPLCTPEEIARLPEPVRTQVNHPRLDDRNFVEAIIPLIQTHYPVDSRRMYLSGFSGGGFFASRLTQEMSEVFAGTQTCGGSLIDTPIVASRASSYVGLIGTRDSTLLSLLEVREVPFVTTLFEDEPEVYTNYVQDLLFALSLSGDPDDRTEEVLTVDGVDIIVWTYATSTSGGDNSVKFILVRDMIHQYPNGTNHDLLAAKFTWNFFTNLSLP